MLQCHVPILQAKCVQRGARNTVGIAPHLVSSALRNLQAVSIVTCYGFQGLAKDQYEVLKGIGRLMQPSG